jgi:GntR family transcriptional regulator
MTNISPIPSELGQRRYALIAERLRAEITTGRWAAGEPIPAETNLMQEFGVALGTMRQAIALLVNEGLLERRHGRGTFVHAGLTGASLLRFFRFGTASEYEIPVSKIHKRSIVPATPELAEQLGLRVGAKVIHILRSRWLQGQPRLLERIWIDAKRFAAMGDSEPKDWGDLLYPEYASRCGVVVHRASETIEFSTLSAADAALLKLPAKHPCALVSRRAFDIAGQCVEVRVTRGDAEAFHYTVHLT